jgi:hypothetical protein
VEGAGERERESWNIERERERGPIEEKQKLGVVCVRVFVSHDVDRWIESRKRTRGERQRGARPIKL